ncbi:MAG TPA: 3-isopropylmalate dehydratase small subunit [Candidatus Acidoferrales bacterium]|nr:3-isopropylmalate dehydratase small subunit [Candidatus Acidoferrales bacterium]
MSASRHLITGSVLALDRANVDTDQIIPAHRLTGIDTAGLGQYLFASMPGGAELLAAHPEATILVARENFGCGSSREHAVWALEDRGFRAVIAPSFARIFEENAYNRGVAPIPVPAEKIEALLGACRISIDLEQQTLCADGGETIRFELDPLRKRFLTEGGYMEFLNSRVPSVREWLAKREAATT